MKKIFSNFIVRMNKKVFVFATAAVCALGTVSCGGDDDGDEAGGGLDDYTAGLGGVYACTWRFS